MAITQIKSTGIANGAVTTQQLAPGAGGGPKITSVDYPGNTSAVSPAGGETVTLIGTGFEANVQVYIANTVAPAVSFTNSNSVSFTTPAKSAGLYMLSAINGDGGAAIYPTFTYSSSPTWVTTSPLPSFAATGPVSVQLSATSDSAVTYALDVGSTLPAGLTLSSSGLLSGTLSSPPGVNTTYNFTVVATDAEQQQSSRAFSISAQVYDFTISPAVGGVSQWTFATNGNLSLTTPGEYTITFAGSYNKVVKMWGSGGMPSTGGVEGWGNGGAGGAATGNVSFVGGSTYKFRVPAAGGTGTAPALAYGAGNGGGTFSCGTAGSGGGYAGIFLETVAQANAVLMAGGGGGGASSRSDCRGGRTGGAGGGTNGQSIDSLHGTGGTQSAGGTGAQGGGNGSALQGGNGTGGGSGAGGGYFGGGGGGSHGDGGSGSGGGSGYFNPSLVSAATLYTGSGTTPGNNSDSDRGSAGTSGTAGTTPGNGKILLIA